MRQAGTTTLAQFSIAVRDGFKKDKTHFFDCKAFGKTAEIVRDYVKKGDEIGINGRLEQETWDDKQTNQKRSKIVIIANQVSLIGGKKQDGQAPTERNTPPPASEPEDENSVPF